MPLRIADLQRNDVPAAVRLIEERLDAGTFTADDGQSIFMLQDDATDLRTALEHMISDRRRRGRKLGPFE